MGIKTTTEKLNKKQEKHLQTLKVYLNKKIKDGVRTNK
jgi:hypothetical protein